MKKIIIIITLGLGLAIKSEIKNWPTIPEEERPAIIEALNMAARIATDSDLSGYTKRSVLTALHPDNYPGLEDIFTPISQSVGNIIEYKDNRTDVNFKKAREELKADLIYIADKYNIKYTTNLGENYKNNIAKPIQKARISEADQKARDLGFEDANDMRMAIKAGFEKSADWNKMLDAGFSPYTKYSEWQEITDQGFLTWKDWNDAKKLQLNTKSELDAAKQKAQADGFGDNLIGWNNAKKGNFTTKAEWDEAQKYGFYNAAEWEAAQKKSNAEGFQNISEWSKAHAYGFNATEWEAAKKSNFIDFAKENFIYPEGHNMVNLWNITKKDLEKVGLPINTEGLDYWLRARNLGIDLDLVKLIKDADIPNLNSGKEIIDALSEFKIYPDEKDYLLKFSELSKQNISDILDTLNNADLKSTSSINDFKNLINNKISVLGNTISNIDEVVDVLSKNGKLSKFADYLKSDKGFGIDSLKKFNNALKEIQKYTNPKTILEKIKNAFDRLGDGIRTKLGITTKIEKLSQKVSSELNKLISEKAAREQATSTAKSEMGAGPIQLTQKELKTVQKLAEGNLKLNAEVTVLINGKPTKVKVAGESIKNAKLVENDGNYYTVDDQGRAELTDQKPKYLEPIHTADTPREFHADVPAPHMPA